MLQNPFDKYDAPPPTPVDRTPVPVFTAPRSPDKVAAEERARSQEQRSIEKDLRDQLEFERKQKQYDITGGVDTTESEKTAAFLTTRLQGAMRDIQEARKLDPDADKPGVGELVAGVFGKEAENWARSSERRRIANAQLTALDSALTLGTGAAYTAEQLESYRESLFPRLTDDPATIRDKRRRFEREIQAGRVKAGASAPSIDKAIAAVDAIYGPIGADESEDAAPPAPPASAAPPPPGTETPPGLPRARPADTSGTAVSSWVPPEKERAILEWTQQNQGNKGVTVEDYSRFLESQGLPALNGPGLAAASGFIKALREGRAGTSGIAIYDPEFERLKEERDTGFNIDAAIRGIADTLTLGSADRMAAAGETLFGEGTYEQNLMQQRRISEADKQVNPVARIGGQVLGGFGLPGASVKSARGLAGLGAAYGGGYGFQSEYGDIGDRVASGLGGAATGGALGGLIGQGAKIYRQRGGAAGAAQAYGPKDATPQEVFEAGQRIGVDLMPADVGGTFTRLGTSAARVMPFSAPSIVSAARRTRDQAMRARQNVAEGIGAPLETLEQAGEMATAGALKYRSASRDAIGRKYERARELSGDSRVNPQNTIVALDQNIAELAETPGDVVGMPYLQKLRDDIVQRGDLTIDGVRGLRTQIRDKFRSEGLTGSDAERRAMMVADAAAEDIAASLDRQGKSAAAALFRRADMEWKERADMMDSVIMPIIGRKGEKSGEEVMRAITTAAQGNNSRFRQFIEALPKDERAGVSATLIANLGRAGPGAQNAAGDAFSLPVFLTHWNQMGRTAKDTILKGEARRAMDDLARVAEGAKASAAFTNYSNTGIAVGAPTTVATLLADLMTFGKVAGSQYIAGRLLASPNVTKALARVSRAKSAAARQRSIGSLSSVAAREPALASDILGLQSRLIEAFGQSPGRLAAQEEQQ